jgi:hypothetical protein
MARDGRAQSENGAFLLRSARGGNFMLQSYVIALRLRFGTSFAVSLSRCVAAVVVSCCLVVLLRSCLVVMRSSWSAVGLLGMDPASCNETTRCGSRSHSARLTLHVSLLLQVRNPVEDSAGCRLGGGRRLQCLLPKAKDEGSSGPDIVPFRGGKHSPAGGRFVGIQRVSRATSCAAKQISCDVSYGGYDYGVLRVRP